MVSLPLGLVMRPFEQAWILLKDMGETPMQGEMPMQNNYPQDPSTNPIYTGSYYNPNTGQVEDYNRPVDPALITGTMSQQGPASPDPSMNFSEKDMAELMRIRGPPPPNRNPSPSPQSAPISDEDMANLMRIRGQVSTPQRR